MFMVGAGYNTHTVYGSKISIKAIITAVNFLKTLPQQK